MSRIVKLLTVAILVIVAVAFFDAFVVMFIWNRFIPVLTGGTFPVASYWAVWGIVLLVDLFSTKVNTAEDGEGEGSTILKVLAAGGIRVVIGGLLLGVAALISLGL